jgi:hypothetical protein
MEAGREVNTEGEELTMKSISPFGRLLLLGGAVALVVAVLTGAKHGIRQVKAQSAVTRDVFVFHCTLIPNQTLESSNLASFNLTFSSAANTFTSPSDCSKVWLDALNAGYTMQSALALPNGGLGGTGATEYVFVRQGVP